MRLDESLSGGEWYRVHHTYVRSKNWVAAPKYQMDDFYDEEGNLSIFKLMSFSDPARAADPATRSLRWALAEQRLAQMATEAEERVRVLKRLG